ncbi:MAG TPA: tetratricopeptide repeat protein, partial [Candidatus Omnitrophota bacterium]|nr:tetratricopeptide repeat protein [Candidatus Omnitrophota bacterium]
MPRKETIFSALFIFATIFAVYGGSLSSGFIWDDQFLVIENPLVRAPLWSFQIFKQDIINSGFNYTIYYRPMQILSYAVDYRIWGMSPFGFHFTNIFIHFLNALLVFILIRLLISNIPVSFCATLLFAVHPAHAGAVSYVSGRADLLALFFLLISMICFTKYKITDKVPYLAGTLAAFLFAMLSKEMAVMVPFLLVAMDAVLLGRIRKFKFQDHIPVFLFLAVYSVFHQFFFKGRYHEMFSARDIAASFVSFGKMIIDFVTVAVCPIGLHMRQGGLPVWMTAFFMIVMAIMTVALFYLKKDRRELFFSTVFFMIAIAPMFFVVRYFKVYAEHWMYTASIGIFLFVSIVIGRLFLAGKEAKIISSAVLLGMVFFYSSVTMTQTRYWATDRALSERVLSFSDKDASAQYYEAFSYMKDKKYEESLNVMDRHMADNKKDPRAWYIKGRFELTAGKAEDARKDFEEAVKVNPVFDDAHFGLALVYLGRGEKEAGVAALNKVLSINPRYIQAHILLTTIYSETGANDKALIFARRAYEIDPYNYEVLVNLGTAYVVSGEVQKGARLFLEASELYPERPAPWYNLAYLFDKSGDNVSAEQYLEK